MVSVRGDDWHGVDGEWCVSPAHVQYLLNLDTDDKHTGVASINRHQPDTQLLCHSQGRTIDSVCHVLLNPNSNFVYVW